MHLSNVDFRLATVQGLEPDVSEIVPDFSLRRPTAHMGSFRSTCFDVPTLVHRTHSTCLSCLRCFAHPPAPHHPRPLLMLGGGGAGQIHGSSPGFRRVGGAAARGVSRERNREYERDVNEPSEVVTTTRSPGDQTRRPTSHTWARPNETK
jgi:hypothetical protein